MLKKDYDLDKLYKIDEIINALYHVFDIQHV